MGHFYINSLLNMSDALKLPAKNKFDTFTISEARLDKTFPEGSCGWVYPTVYDTNLV